MSELLDALIEQRRREALDYKAYLSRIVELTRQVGRPENQTTYPPAIDSGALRALYDNLGEELGAAVSEPTARYGDDDPSGTREGLAVRLDASIRAVKKADWRGNRFKEREVRNAILAQLGKGDDRVDRIFELVKAQRDY